MNRQLIDGGPVTLGTNVFGWTVDQRAAPDLLDAFLAAGGTHIDTADAYPFWAPGCSGGEAESAIGGWLGDDPARRGAVCLATKVGIMPGSTGLSGDNIRACVRRSLARLRTDHVDVLYFHMDDPRVDPAESVAAVRDLVAEGRVGHLAVSNYPVQRLEALLRACDRTGAPRPVLYQGQYHLLNRGYAETRLAPVLRAESIPFMPHSSLANGFLTGKYVRGARSAGARSANVGRYLTEEGWAVLEEVRSVAARRGASPAGVALAWLRSRTGVVPPAVSVSDVRQIPEVMERATLTDEDIARLDKVSEPFLRP